MPLSQELKKRLNWEDPWLAVGIFSAVSIIFCFALFHNFDYWGQKDWDQFTFWNAVARRSILEYRQFPLWNPYANGGNVLFAHPHSGFLSPFFIFVVLFGPVIGLKLQIFIFLFAGMLGMFYVARFFEIKGISLYVPPFIFMLNSVFPLHLTEGHVEFLSMGLIPWAFLFVLKSTKDARCVVYAALILSLMIFLGSVYPLVVFSSFLCAYQFFQCLKTRDLSYIRILFLILGVAFLLSAVKIFPMLDFLAESGRVAVKSDGAGWPLILRMLTDRSQEIYDAINWKPTGVDEWHEYGAYIGIIPLALFLISIPLYFKKQWPLVLSSLLGLLIVAGNRSYVDLWGVLHNLPIFKSLSTPGTFMVAFILGFSILSGLSMYRIESAFNARCKRKALGHLMTKGIALFILCDLVLVNSPLFKNAFIIEPMKINPLPYFCQIQGEVLVPGQRSSLYPAFLKNCGVVNGYEVITVRQGAVSVYPESLRSILSKDALPDTTASGIRLADVDARKGNARADYFSPNIIRVTARMRENGMLVLNQNFMSGWKIREPGYTVFAQEGLMATWLPEGMHRLTFYYMPCPFLIGLGFSMIGAVCAFRLLHQKP